MSTSVTRSLKGKHFAFFGGSSGIGLSAAETLARQGAHIALIGRTQKSGQAAVERLLAAGAPEAVFLDGDLSTIKGAEAAAQKVQRWSPVLDGIVHSALSGFNKKILTSDGLEFCHAMVYQARVTVDSVLLDNLSASGDGRIVHLAGAAPAMMMPDLDDLQYEKRSWGFWKSLLGSHNLAILFIQKASTEWSKYNVSIAATCVGPTKTPGAVDPNMLLLMRLGDYFATTPAVSAGNVVHYLSTPKIEQKDRFGIFWKATKPVITPPALPQEKADKLWQYTKTISTQHGVELKNM